MALPDPVARLTPRSPPSTSSDPDPPLRRRFMRSVFVDPLGGEANEFDSYVRSLLPAQRPAAHARREQRAIAANRLALSLILWLRIVVTAAGVSAVVVMVLGCITLASSHDATALTVAGGTGVGGSAITIAASVLLRRRRSER